MAKRDKAGIGLEDLRPPEYKEPVSTPDREREIQRAASLHAKAEASDPFARGRIICHMRRGIELPSDVIATASSRLAARGQSTDAPSLARAA